MEPMIEVLELSHRRIWIMERDSVSRRKKEILSVWKQYLIKRVGVKTENEENNNCMYYSKYIFGV